MSDFYLGKLNIEAILKLKDKAWEGKQLDIAVWVNNDVDHSNKDENWKAVSISYGNKKKGEEVVYLGNAKKFVAEEKVPF